MLVRFRGTKMKTLFVLVNKRKNRPPLGHGKPVRKKSHCQETK